MCHKTKTNETIVQLSIILNLITMARKSGKHQGVTYGTRHRMQSRDSTTDLLVYMNS